MVRAAVDETVLKKCYLFATLDAKGTRSSHRFTMQGMPFIDGNLAFKCNWLDRDYGDPRRKAGNVS